MTVGIAAMAEGGRAIVLCADRQRTGGAMRHEGRIAKKREIGYGWRFLYEDSGTRADFLRDALLDRLQMADFGRDASEALPVMTARQMVEHVRAEFLTLRDKAAKGRLNAEGEFDLGVLLVGFDEENLASGFRFFEDGDCETIREVGYGTIGEGEIVAEATLAQYRVPYDDPLDHVLWKVYEAKRRADALITSVGSTTDLWIMTNHERMQTFRAPQETTPGARPMQVPPRILDVLGGVFEWISSSPWTRKQEPVVWGSTLARYVQEVMEGKNPS
jgi:hypothetical protein